MPLRCCCDQPTSTCINLHQPRGAASIWCAGRCRCKSTPCSQGACSASATCPCLPRQPPKQLSLKRRRRNCPPQAAAAAAAIGGQGTMLASQRAEQLPPVHQRPSQTCWKKSAQSVGDPCPGAHANGCMRCNASFSARRRAHMCTPGCVRACCRLARSSHACRRQPRACLALPCRAAASAGDKDGFVALVAEAASQGHSVLVFCATKRSCESETGGPGYGAPPTALARARVCTCLPHVIAACTIASRCNDARVHANARAP